MELIRKIYSTLAGNRKDVEVTKGLYKCLQSGNFRGHLLWVGGGEDLLCMLLNQWEEEKACFVSIPRHTIQFCTLLLESTLQVFHFVSIRRRSQ